MTRARSVVTAFAVALAFAGAPGAAPADGLRAGLGVALLPAPLGGPLAGYGGLRDRNADGVLDAPEARALVLERGDVRIALLTLDVLIVRPETRIALERAAAASDVDAIVVTATHTHSGPGGNVSGFVAERVTGGSYDPDAPGRLQAAAERALSRALADLAPAAAASAVSSLRLAENRRWADGAVETALPVLRIDVRERPPILLFSYAAHPIVLPPRSHAYSADWVGSARAHVSAAGWRPVFVAGPLGDQAPRSQLGPLWPEARADWLAQRDEIGHRVARAALDAALGLEPRRDVALGAARSEVELPETRLRRFCALWWLSPLVGAALDDFIASDARVHALHVGDARLVALPAEPTSEVGEAIRGRVRAGAHAFVLAHAGDWLGYVVSEDGYARGGYEACMSFHGPELAARLVDASQRALVLLESRTTGGSE